TDVQEGNHIAKIYLQGKVEPAAFLVTNRLAGVGRHLQGSSQMKTRIDLPFVKNEESDLRPRIVIESDMLGTAITLPKPFTKPADSPGNLYLDISFIREGYLLADFNYQSWLKSRLGFETGEGLDL